MSVSFRICLEYAANLCETDTLTPADLPEILTLKARPCEKTEPGPAAVRNSGEQVLAGLLEKYGYTLEGKNKSQPSWESVSEHFTASLTASTYSSLIIHCHDKVLYI